MPTPLHSVAAKKERLDKLPLPSPEALANLEHYTSANWRARPHR